MILLAAGITKNENNVDYIETPGRMLKVANLVEDEPEYRKELVNYLTM